RGLHLVGATGFEPATTCTPSKCATRLRYAPRTARVAARSCGVMPSGLGKVKNYPHPDRFRASSGRLAELLIVVVVLHDVVGATRDPVQRVLEDLARAEGQHAARRDLDLLAGLRVAAHA